MSKIEWDLEMSSPVNLTALKLFMLLNQLDEDDFANIIADLMIIRGRRDPELLKKNSRLSGQHDT